AQHEPARMGPGAAHEPELGERERADRALGVARHPDRRVRRDRRMHRARQERFRRARDLERELQDLRARQRPRFRVEVAHDGEAIDDGGQLQRAEGGHQALTAGAPLAGLLSAKAGITSLANSRRLASTSACGMISIAFIRKLTRSTPTASQRLSACITRCGPPNASPSPACSVASGPVVWRRSWGRRPSDWYERLGNASRAEMSCEAR